MSAFVQLYLAQVREWQRDLTALLWSMLFPVVIAIIVGAVFSSTGRMFFRVGVVNEAGEVGQSLLAGLQDNDAFQITSGAREDELDELEEGRRDAVVIFPPELAASFDLSAAPITDPANQIPFDVIYDPTSPNGPAAMNLIQQAVTVMEANITGELSLLTVRTAAADVQRQRSADYMLPGVLALSMLLLGLYVTAIPLVSLRQKEVLRRMGTTPLSRVTLLLSQFAFRMTVALIQTLVIIGISVVLYDLPLKSDNLPAIIGMVLLGAAVFIALGYVLAALAKTEESVQVLAGLPFLVFSLLSGVLVPLWRIPSSLQPLVDAIPLTYLADALRQLMTGANPVYSMTTNILVLVAWLVGCSLLAIRFFRWEPAV